MDALTIVGTGQSVTLGADGTTLAITNGADLTISGLTLTGPGGFDIENRSAAGKGIFIDVRDDRTGTLRLTLNEVTVADVAGHGIHVPDCALANDCGGGGAGDGSDASISVVATGVTVRGMG